MLVTTPAVVAGLRPVAKALPRTFVAGAALAALASLVVLRSQPRGGLVTAGVLLACGLAPVLDDRAATTLEPSPTPRWVRRAMPLALTLPLLGLAWLALLAVAVVLAPAGTSVPLALSTWHWFGMICVVLIVSCSAGSLSVPSFDGSPAVAGLLGVLLGDSFLQQIWPKLGLFLLGEPDVSSRLQTRMVALGALAVLAFAISARDPAR